MADLPVERIAEVRELSDRLVVACIEGRPDVAIIALLDAAVRITRHAKPGLDTPGACKELSRVVRDMGRAEAGD
jgi:hypothetical protein